MNSSIKSKLIVGGTVAVLAVIGTLMNSPHAVLQAAGGPTVTIDSSQLPLSVKFNSPPTIAFGNTASTPLFTQDVDNSARHPFQFTFTNTTGSVYIVPPDQRLTIETISAGCVTDPPSTARPFFPTSITTTVGGKTAIYNVLTSFLATGTGSVAGIQFYDSAATMVRIYADPGTTVQAFTGSGGARCDVAISGTLIPK
jgi:hypothetical protein